MESALQAVQGFDLVVDDGAQRWLAAHPEVSQLFLTFESTLCCSGVRVCDVRIRLNVVPRRAGAQGVSWLSLGDVEGRQVWLDPRIKETMPRQIAITRRGIGPLRHLELNLNGDEWAELLYPPPR
jgi:hypothetical protein